MLLRLRVVFILFFYIINCFLPVFSKFTKTISEENIALRSDDVKDKLIDALKKKDEYKKLIQQIILTIQKTRSKSQQRECYIIQKINGITITNIDIINAIRFVFFSAGRPYDPKVAKLMEEAVLSSLIDSKLHKICAERMGFKITDKDIEQKVEEIAKNNNMTIAQLSENFGDSGINMYLFKEELKAKMTMFFIANIMKNFVFVTQNEKKEEKKKLTEEFKFLRYHLFEMLFKLDGQKDEQKVLKEAEDVLKLVKNGFNLRVLGESLNQSNEANVEAGDSGFISVNKMEKSVRDAVTKMSCGKISPVLKTHSGYKIIYLIDIAAPQQKAESNAKYHVLHTHIRYNHNALVMMQDKNKFEMMINELRYAKNSIEFKEICIKHKLQCVEKKIDQNMPYEMNILRQVAEQEKASRGFVALFPTETTAPKTDDAKNIEEFEIMFVVEIETEKAVLPSDEKIEQMIVWRKTNIELVKMLRQMKSSVNVED